ncbi:centromeric protein E [Entomortierella parvispora]|uniref:Kinesin-like protein n=1 Tax=Entomortierella parvispora TaxID=205924 RepID=A0A9P3HGZ7_9FUNG|nr:centromeric protein E [Entomortierella parvispora]
MFKSVADRLGFPHSTSNSSLSSHPSSGASSPTSSSSGHHHRTSIFSSAPHVRSPSRQQQQTPLHGRTAPSASAATNGRATTPAGPRRAAPSVKPVLPPLTFNNSRDDSNSLYNSVTSAGSTTDEQQQPSRAAENVTVSVRVRPFSVTELRVAGGPAEVWAVQEESRITYADEYTMAARRAAVDYAYDHALTGSDNELIYSSSVKHLVQSAMEGYNGTVFAYGQTSSGKTYTMSGAEKQPGITPRAVDDVFKYIRENSEREFLLRVSYLEIYNESIRDLLSPEAIDLRIHEDKKRGVYVSPLKEEIVTTPSQVMRILQRGDQQRHTSSTDYNAHSSRSHSIFQIVIESRERAPTAPLSPSGRKFSLGLGKSPSAVRVSQLNLIDLAGSEKASSDADRRKEGAFINKSLLTLGTVISKLTEEKGAHIPYRDSKLTRILQSSLSGNARVSVICTISPSFMNVEESHNTLKFAARVKKVVTKAHTNQVMDDKALLEKYRREISELKAQLLLTAAAGGDSTGEERFGDLDKEKHAELSHLLEKERLKHEEEMVEMNMVRNALKERIEHLTKLILTSQSINAKGGTGPNSQPAAMGRYTVETTADGTVLEFPKEIESRLARKDTIVRQLQNELEDQQSKVAMMKNALQRTAMGEVVDIEKTLAKLEMEPPRDKFLIEKRASIMNMNGFVISEGTSGEGGQLVNRLASKKRFGKDLSSSPDALTGTSEGPTQNTAEDSDLKDDDASILLPEGESLAIDDEDEDHDLMDTPWNRAELISLRQAKRELEIVVIEQEKKLEDMVAFEDSDEFRNLVLELEDQRERILVMEEERETLKATIADQRNTIRRLELDHLESGRTDSTALGGMAAASTSPSVGTLATSPSSSSFTAAMAAAAASKIRELEAMLQRERRFRMEEQTQSMTRIASLEADLTILQAERSVRECS